MIQKFGKSYKLVSELKRDFVEDNRTHLLENNKIAKIYSNQIRREKCKICDANIDSNAAFHSHGLNYYHCQVCGHVNGEYLETNSFTEKIYEKADYGKNYKMDTRESYGKRLNEVYLPKAEFMSEALKKYGLNPNDFKYLDVGAGSGFYVGALKKLGLITKGIEISADQVDYANEMLGIKALECVSQDEVVPLIKKTDADVLSFIGVLEHIVNLHDVLNAINENDRIKYIYFSVPMLSYSVFWESVSEDVFNRLLGGSHTHIFTESSLNYIYNYFGWENIAEWNFGTDVADLERIVQVLMMQNKNEYLANMFKEKMSEILDDIQLIIDKQGFCSEKHVLVKKLSF